MAVPDTADRPLTGGGTREVGQREFAALITLLIAVPALGMDVMLPAFPQMRDAFGFAPGSANVGLVVSTYVFGMAFGPWLFGPLSDERGRRGPVFVALGLYCTSAAVAAVSFTWPMLLVARVVWGISAGGVRSLALASVRDRYGGDRMARLMGLVMSVFMVVPVLAPGLGALLLHLLPWRSVLWFPVVAGLVIMAWMRRLPETLDPAMRRSLAWGSVLDAVREVLRHRQVMALVMAMTFLQGIMTMYLASSPTILEEVFDLGDWFPLFFGGMAVVLSLNSMSNSRLCGTIGAIRLLRVQSWLAIGTSVVMLAIALLTDGAPPFWLFVLTLMTCVPLAQGLGPTSNAVVMTPLPHIAGTAASIITTIVWAGGAIIGSIGTSAFDGTITPFAAAYCGFAVVASAFVLVGTPRAGGELQPVRQFVPEPEF